MEKEERTCRRPKQSASGLDGFWAAEMGLCITYFCLGLWQFQTGWDNPKQIGWIQGGAVYMIGMLACAWLAWIRRNTQRNTFLHILLIAQLSEATQRGYAWRAHEEGAEWPMANSILAIIMLALILWEAHSARKAAAKDAACEQKFFELDDKP